MQIKEPTRNALSRGGKIGGPRGSHADKVRAGHAGAAKRLHRMADEAQAVGKTADAADFREKAMVQEKLAK